MSNGIIAFLFFALLCGGVYAGYRAVDQFVDLRPCRFAGYCAAGQR